MPLFGGGLGLDIAKCSVQGENINIYTSNLFLNTVWKRDRHVDCSLPVLPPGAPAEGCRSTVRRLQGARKLREGFQVRL